MGANTIQIDTSTIVKGFDYDWTGSDLHLLGDVDISDQMEEHAEALERLSSTIANIYVLAQELEEILARHQEAFEALSNIEESKLPEAFQKLRTEKLERFIRFVGEVPIYGVEAEDLYPDC